MACKVMLMLRGLHLAVYDCSEVNTVTVMAMHGSMVVGGFRVAVSRVGQQVCGYKGRVKWFPTPI
jgi:hypothetical protein